jgi:hypothetical protein
MWLSTTGKVAPVAYVIQAIHFGAMSAVQMLTTHLRRLVDDGAEWLSVRCLLHL